MKRGRTFRMPFQCQAVSEQIQKPQSGIVFRNSGASTPPFDLKGPIVTGKQIGRAHV